MNQREIESRWRDVESDIKCPLKLKPESCRKRIEGIKRGETTLSHSAVVFTAECNFCGERASEMGNPFG